MKWTTSCLWSPKLIWFQLVLSRRGLCRPFSHLPRGRGQILALGYPRFRSVGVDVAAQPAEIYLDAVHLVAQIFVGSASLNKGRHHGLEESVISHHGGPLQKIRCMAEIDSTEYTNEEATPSRKVWKQPWSGDTAPSYIPNEKGNAPPNWARALLSLASTSEEKHLQPIAFPPGVNERWEQ